MNALPKLEHITIEELFDLLDPQYHGLLKEGISFLGNDFVPIAMQVQEEKKYLTGESLIFGIFEKISFQTRNLVNDSLDIIKKYKISDNQLNIQSLYNHSKQYFFNKPTPKIPEYITQNVTYNEDVFKTFTGISFESLMKMTRYIVNLVEGDEIKHTQKSHLFRFVQKWVFDYLYNYTLYRSIKYDEILLKLPSNKKIYSSDIKFDRKNLFLSLDEENLDGDLNFDFKNGTLVIFLAQKILDKMTPGFNMKGLSQRGSIYLSNQIESLEEQKVIYQHELIHRRNHFFNPKLANEINNIDQILPSIMGEILAWSESGNLNYDFKKDRHKIEKSKFDYFYEEIIEKYFYNELSKIGISRRTKLTKLEEYGIKQMKEKIKNGIHLVFELNESYGEKWGWGVIPIILSPENRESFYRLTLEQKNL